VLVNSVASKTRNLSEAGAISRAFLSAGGAELQKVILCFTVAYIVEVILKNSHRISMRTHSKESIYELIRDQSDIKGKKDRETDMYKRNIHSMQSTLEL